ncbi:hypothetical protein GLX27_003917 [Malassezia furfur]|uniref:Neuroguidin n=1 Tax=Malassezia furfur TaxID=55194 RepID=A0ABY8EUF3_MALFU|nr:hypothetical protein CBS14141_003968 [Malassezia furfur]WFD49237.1 hypothetical protein GLX27_003917 [Malassezia furfur]
MASALGSEVAALGAAIAKSLQEVRPQVDKLKDSYVACSRSSDNNQLEFPDGLSLLTVKVDALLACLHHMALLCAHRVSGKSLTDNVGAEYVERLVKLRLVLEKMRPMETRIKYQVEKLLQAASAAEKALPEDDEIDPLAFRPNPEALASAGGAPGRAADEDEDEEEEGATYKPPKVAPVLYDPDARPSRNARNRERQPSRNAALLADLTAGMSTNPYETSTAGVGGGAVGTAGSSRARALQRMQEFEEDNYKRLSMSKKDAKRRRRDEQDVALGGLGLSAHKDRIGGGIEEEFGDLLRGSERDARRRERGEGAYDLLAKRAAKAPRNEPRAARRSDAGRGDELVSGSASAHRFKKAMRSQRRKAR